MKFREEIKNFSDSLERDLYFIQIGCNDGKMADPIGDLVVENNWKGMLVDADPYYLQKAKENYDARYRSRMLDFSNSLKFLHMGILPRENGGEIFRFEKFYSINPDAIRPKRVELGDCSRYLVYGDIMMPTDSNFQNVDSDLNNPLDYLQGVGSFSYDFVLEHLERVTKKTDTSGEISRLVFSEDKKTHPRFINTNFIPCTTINSLFEIFNFKQIDLLQTDMEGWDVKIMSDIDDFMIKPKFIHFEAASSFGGLPEDLRQKFKKNGYEIFKTEDTKDILAIRSE